MTVSLSQLLEDSFQIAWEYVERSGELGDGASASRFLSDVIETMIREGKGGRLALSNRAISAYQRFRSFGAESPSISMVGDMFNTQLKAKLDALCSDIAA